MYYQAKYSCVTIVYCLLHSCFLTCYFLSFVLWKAYNNGLTGTIPDSLGSLTALMSLDLGTHYQAKNCCVYSCISYCILFFDMIFSFVLLFERDQWIEWRNTWVFRLFDSSDISRTLYVLPIQVLLCLAIALLLIVFLFLTFFFPLLLLFLQTLTNWQEQYPSLLVLLQLWLVSPSVCITKPKYWCVYSFTSHWNLFFF